MSQEPAVPNDPHQATTFPQLIRSAAAAYGDAPAVVLRDASIPDESATFTELDARSAEIARGLLARGVGKGSRIGFICGNGPRFAIWFAAAARIGAIAIPISTLIRANELVRVLRQSDVHGLYVQRELLGKDYVERLCEALPDLATGTSPELRIAKVPYLRWIISHGDDLPPTFRSMDFLTEAAATIDDAFLREVESEVHTSDQIVEIYTSGSMALPKGVKHNHGPVLFRSRYLKGMFALEPGQEKQAMMPMFWVGGLMMWLVPDWQAGAVTVCTERTMSNSRMAFGSVLSDDDLALLSKAPKPWWGLGMSETLGPYSYGDDFRAPGYPVCAPMDHFADGYDVRVADENDQPVGDGEVGEMQLRGYPVATGLHKLEKAGYYTADGYIKTGDMCRIEDRPQGRRVHFVGRSGDMIKTMGSNVSPAEVEMEMQSLDGVHNAFVLGLPDQERGQLLVAAVVPRDGVELDFAAIEAELRKRLSGYKVPRAYVAFTREEVPLLHSNKIARREIAAMLAERLGRDV
ncbi:acyl-CoA synthetase (AMP-forming)/AMP-acid ligase II [Novosphingobium chloroacetimidivorans]|uniref:Acyl-CoA synthetase (AMP-forming)/AMP-acid ligase II n=1 Tax=Novosphingobium chloroacetimidivorans TaxID=1428314 RepID=A0A7W7NWW0_9SPHN|nr:class I adenylate-forming enzyme family protein [Novosphingobium chloroacetimidivorans]MBB4858502.1 acyl-CoA synthetase (AMP-forming)/AMP-acid ligase II [Novosphingobium chloroacetimidivorans]